MSRPLTSLKGFLDRINEIRPAKDSGISIFFRGHSDKDYLLEPSLYRKDSLVKAEHIMYRTMILQNPSEFASDQSTLEKLVRMQHFSMPTRLLDLSENPVVALYFACSNQNGKTGEVAYLTVPEREVKYYDSDTVSVLANLAKIPYDEKLYDTGLERNQFNSKDNVTKLVHDIREEKPYFQYLIEPCDLHRVLCVRVKMNNKRIIVQDGLFLIYGLGKDQSTYAAIDSAWTPAVKNRNMKILIDSDSKGKIRKELELINISERTLFPDIETTAKSIIARYG